MCSLQLFITLRKLQARLQTCVTEAINRYVCQSFLLKGKPKNVLLFVNRAKQDKNLLQQNIPSEVNFNDKIIKHDSAS